MQSIPIGVSVVIPTYNYKNLLKMTLDSLCLQDLDKSRFEVIVADDGSSDGSDELVKTYIDKLNIKYFYQPDMGFRVAKARNEGVNLARYDTILLLDSGIIASKKLLSVHYNIHRNNSDSVLIGLSYGVNEYSCDNFDKLSQLYSSNSIEKSFLEISKHPELNDCRYEFLSKIDFDLTLSSAPWVISWTGHLSFKKASFDNVGGFDEWFCSWGGEDVDLGIRLYNKGCRFEVLNSTETIHFPHDKNEDEKRNNSKKNINYICKKYNFSSVEKLKTCNWNEILSQSF